VLEATLALLNPVQMIETEQQIGDDEDWRWLDEIAEPDHVDELITVVPEEALHVSNNEPILSPKQRAIYDALKRYGRVRYSSIVQKFGTGSSQHLHRLRAKGFASNDGGVWRAL
jgi:hypothetical protein